MTGKMEHIIDLILEDGDDETVTEAILLETEEERIVKSMGNEVTLMNYLIKFEEYLDDHDVYLFDGWEQAVIIDQPEIEKFWCTFYLQLNKNSDLRGAKRIMNDKEGQNSVKKKQLDDGKTILKIKILKHYLDDIEKKNKQKAKDLSDEEMGKVS